MCSRQSGRTNSARSSSSSRRATACVFFNSPALPPVGAPLMTHRLPALEEQCAYTSVACVSHTSALRNATPKLARPVWGENCKMPCHASSVLLSLRSLLDLKLAFWSSQRRLALTPALSTPEMAYVLCASCGRVNLARTAREHTVVCSMLGHGRRDGGAACSDAGRLGADIQELHMTPSTAELATPSTTQDATVRTATATSSSLLVDTPSEPCRRRSRLQESLRALYRLTCALQSPRKL
jgi:hypothetical protein